VILAQIENCGTKCSYSKKTRQAFKIGTVWLNPTFWPLAKLLLYRAVTRKHTMSGPNILIGGGNIRLGSKNMQI